MFLVGELIACSAFQHVHRVLVPFAAGNFIYIGTSDLVPEINKHPDIRAGAIHFVAFLLGVAPLLATRVVLG